MFAVVVDVVMGRRVVLLSSGTSNGGEARV